MPMCLKVGILTHCLATNYGANLQALSTAYYLRNHGYEPVFLVWNVYLAKVNSKMNQEQVRLHTTILQRSGFKVTEACISPEDFREVLVKERISNIIVGSDAVLTVKPFIDSIHIGRRGITWGNIQADYLFPNPFWLDFLDDSLEVKAFLMSPSCQSSNYKMLSGKTKKQMASQLKKFCYLSARDSYTQRMICEIADMNVESVPVTPDPVWNFNENVGLSIPSKEKLLAKYGISDDNYLIVSFYPAFMKKTHWLEQLRIAVQNRGKRLFFLPMPQDNNSYPIDTISLPIDSLDYFALIKYSKGYIGNNMHPIICAIHNSVPFVSIDQHGKWYLRGCIQRAASSKVFDLLSRFGLNENRINQMDFGKYSPKDILQMLESTNIRRMVEMSASMQKQYKDMMEVILSKFSVGV